MDKEDGDNVKGQNLVRMNLIVKRIESELDQLKNLINLQIDGLSASSSSANCEGNEGDTSINDDSYCPMDILKIEDDQVSTTNDQDNDDGNNYQDFNENQDNNSQNRPSNENELILGGLSFNFKVQSKEDHDAQNDESFFPSNLEDIISDEAQNQIFNRCGTSKNYTCRFCLKKFGSYSILSRHEEVHSKDLSYSCQYCEKQFSAVNNLRVHVHRTHRVKSTNFGKEPNKLLGPSSSGQASSKSKKSKIKNRRESKETVESTNTSNNLIGIGQDGSTSTANLASTSSLIDDITSILPQLPSETDQIESQIEIDSQNPGPSSNLNVPKTSAKNKNPEGSLRNLRCKVCFKTFASKQILIRHVEVHSSDLTYKCQFCTNKSFKTINNLRVHVHRSHRSERVDLPIKCSDCSSTFSCESALENHRIESHVGISCILCSEQFNKREYLYKHIRNIHFVCPIGGCMIQFTNKVELLQHKMEFHSKSQT